MSTLFSSGALPCGFGPSMLRADTSTDGCAVCVCGFAGETVDKVPVFTDWNFEEEATGSTPILMYFHA